MSTETMKDCANFNCQSYNLEETNVIRDDGYGFGSDSKTRQQPTDYINMITGITDFLKRK
jgi:hypothetical protein